MKKILRIILIIIVCLIILIIIIISPLFISTDRIRRDMLKQTPIGASMDEVINFLKESDKWKIDGIKDNHGYTILDDGRPMESGGRPIGVKSIRVHMAPNNKIFANPPIVVFFGFDEDSKLIEITARKDAWFL